MNEAKRPCADGTGTTNRTNEKERERPSDGSLFIKDRKVAGFSGAEENLAELNPHVPHLTESELLAWGTLYRKAGQPWAAFAVENRRIITGQNPASGGAVADLVISRLKRAA